VTSITQVIVLFNALQARANSGRSDQDADVFTVLVADGSECLEVSLCLLNRCSQGNRVPFGKSVVSR
jgi:hypothetical protein